MAAASSVGHIRQQLHRLARALLQQARRAPRSPSHHLGDADLLDARHEKGVARKKLDNAKAAHAAADHVMRSSAAVT